MGEIKFSDNYSDLSVQHGVNAGFQFEFHCERCNDTWRTGFVPYRSGQASGWVGKAAGLFGGILGGVGEAAEGLAQSGWREARDTAFKDAIGSAMGHFNRCAKCFQYVCATCFNKSGGLCYNCAPSAEVEIEASRAQGMASAAGEKAALEGNRRGQKMDVTRDSQLVCPQCRAETHGAKFCPECGMKLAVAGQCPGCNAAVQPGAKFCPECGQKLTG
jgi:hypothetical protein